MRRVPWAVLLVFLCVGALGQPGRMLPRPHSPVSRVPPWRGYGEKNPPPAGQYIFFDQSAGEYVVCYREGLARQDPDHGKLVVYRFHPSFVAEAGFGTAVGMAGPGEVVYEYSVANLAGSKEAIWWFSLAIPDNADVTHAEHSTWVGYGVPRMGPPVAPQTALYPEGEIRDPANLGWFLSWTKGSAKPIPPGGGLDGFRLRSHQLPGIITAFAVAEGRRPPSLTSPGEVIEQYAPLAALENDWRTAVTIGPRFAPSATPKTVASEYARALAHLVTDGWLPSASAYVGELRRFCGALAATGRPIRLSIASTPSSRLEADIGMALAFTLEHLDRPLSQDRQSAK